MQTWKEVWERRTLDPLTGSTLSAIMNADGLDTGFGTMSETSWRRFVADSATTLGIAADSSVFEVGCGAGAFQYELAQQGCRVGGSDISSAQIRHIERVIPDGKWSVHEAIQTDPLEKYDFVLAMGVFLYFPSEEYAFHVLSRMARKATLAIAVLDVADAAKKEDALRFRQGTLGDEEYKARYEGLDHLYLGKQWMEESLKAIGFNRYHIVDQEIEGYGNSSFRFNAFAWHEDA